MCTSIHPVLYSVAGFTYLSYRESLSTLTSVNNPYVNILHVKLLRKFKSRKSHLVTSIGAMRINLMWTWWTLVFVSRMRWLSYGNDVLKCLASQWSYKMGKVSSTKLGDLNLISNSHSVEREKIYSQIVL